MRDLFNARQLISYLDACSPSFENFDVFNYYVMFNLFLTPSAMPPKD
jgi:hypothetical protein